MIIRAKKQKRFTTVDNTPFQDKRLTYEAKGLVGYLLTKPDGWEIRIADLLDQESEVEDTRHAGREKIFRMLRELKTCGYLYRTQVNGPDGRFETVCELYENPADNPHLGSAEGDKPQEFPELDEPDEPKRTVVGKAAHGGTAVGKAVHGKAVDGIAVNGKAHRIVNTDLEEKTEGSKDGGSSKNGRNERTNGSLPPHMRGWDALHSNGLSPEEQQLMNTIRAAFNFHNAEDALDATRALSAANVTEWGEDQQLLLATLRRIAKGVAAATLFRDWLSLWNDKATPDELIRLFGNNRDTSWWVNASGMKGMPWPSQVANNLALAREWETTPHVAQAQTGQRKTTQAMSSLEQFAATVRELQGGGS